MPNLIENLGKFINITIHKILLKVHRRNIFHCIISNVYIFCCLLVVATTIWKNAMLDHCRHNEALNKRQLVTIAISVLLYSFYKFIIIERVIDTHRHRLTKPRSRVKHKRTRQEYDLSPLRTWHKVEWPFPPARNVSVFYFNRRINGLIEYAILCNVIFSIHSHLSTSPYLTSCAIMHACFPTSIVDQQCELDLPLSLIFHSQSFKNLVNGVCFIPFNTTLFPYCYYYGNAL